ncbi:hypothetical protein O2U01_11265 (plasmid) [Ligilactobacillus salivarius]|uniref:Uncharacterized protein n=2 Tax=Ligilactobacillus salivarius TaxID=1624 RepID=A0AAQ3EVA5_9LACO|nr:hypothetical protein [Ligilactobacillus salivarius]WHS05230.1 hypothetical protein O2U07_01095 [Ligilactobacillus salivarius]WHS07121.1 hypothetical protein O2U05_00695 [Ligilactobacillus salivarius]WHS07154.1 hypothetical protein O2U05_00015 [Ligilactobacillus salivarius]WHS11027.1 hypothetical protein O2U04_09550 [Ligilactobacillus salivarius]WHS11036.1 hypothetical protein O2U04_09595 [Ligilactobacillus salivarius]
MGRLKGNTSEDKALRDNVISSLLAVGMSKAEIARIFSLTPTKILNVEKSMVAKPNIFEDYLVNTGINYFAIPDKDGYLTPSLKVVPENFEVDKYIEWIKTADNDALLLEHSRIKAMLKAGVDSEETVVKLASINAMIDRQRDINTYTSYITGDYTTKETQRKKFDAATERLTQEIATQIDKGKREVDKAQKEYDQELKRISREQERAKKQSEETIAKYEKKASLSVEKYEEYSLQEEKILARITRLKKREKSLRDHVNKLEGKADDKTDSTEDVEDFIKNFDK